MNNSELQNGECEKTTNIVVIAQMLLEASNEVSNYQLYQKVYGALTEMDSERKRKANNKIEFCIEKLLELQVNIDHLIS